MATRSESLSDDPVPAITLAHAAARAALEDGMSAGTLQRVRRGAYTEADDGGPDQGRRRRALARIAALHAQLATEFWFSHTSAALVWGCWTLLPDERTHITQIYNPGGPRDAHVVRHTHALPARERSTVGEFPVTSLERTTVDCAASLPGYGALIVADSALRLGADRAEIARIVAGRTGYRGIARARRALILADPRSESPGESSLRWICRQHPDLPVFTPQLEVETRDGRYRVDLGNREYKIALEFDGQVKYSGQFGDLPTTALAEQSRRQAALEEQGWIVVRFTWADLFDHGAVLDRIVAAVARARRRP